MAWAIQAKGLGKLFRIRRKQAGLSGSLRAMFRPEYTEIPAVAGLDLAVAAGESVAFIGPNGAGKSTTIKMLTGILHPTAGTATVLGHTPWRERQQLAYRIGSVFGQKSQLWYHLPPQDSFDLLGRIYDLSPADYRRQRDLLVEAFDLGDLLTVPVRRLSLGQRMRCEVAASLLHRPEAIFLDEPTIGLDVVAKQTIRDLIRRWNRETGVTVFLTSHDAGDIEQVCKRAIVIHDGRLIFDGPVATLRRQYLQHKVINLRLGAPYEAFALPGVDVLKSSPFGVKLRVDTKQQPIEAVVAELLQRLQITDITIEDPPMEEIIAAIYQGGAPVGTPGAATPGAATPGAGATREAVAR